MRIKAYLRDLFIILEEVEARYMDEYLRKALDGFRITCEVTAARLIAAIAPPDSRTSSMSPERKDVSGSDCGQLSHQSRESGLLNNDNWVTQWM